MEKLPVYLHPLRLFLLAIILLTMYNNLEHSASVYRDIAANPAYSDGYNTFQSYMVVIVIDLAVIAFIISAKKRESEVFAWVLFLVNCLFFRTIDSFCTIAEALVHPVESPMLITEINRTIAKVVFSGLFSYSIHRFSFLWVENQQQDGTTHMITLQKKIITELTGEKKNLQREIELLNRLMATNEEAKTLRHENQQVRARLTRKKQIQ